MRAGRNRNTDGSCRFKEWKNYEKNDGKAIGLVSAILPNVKAAPADAWGVTAEEVEAIIEENYKEAEWTGTIRHHDGREEEITVPVMKDTVTGKTVLGDVKRKILCADYADYAFKESLTPRTLEDGASWDEAELLTYYNYIRVWDYYELTGWTGPDGFGTPSLLLMNLVYENGNPIDNACYCGREIWTWPEGGTDRVAAVVREGSYAVAIIIDGADMEEETYYLYSENGWEEYDYNSLFDKFKEKDEKCVIEVGSGERKELAAPEW